MNNTNKTATININGISTTTRIRMLEEFLYKHDADLALSQEVTNTKITMFRRYTPHINMGTEGRANHGGASWIGAIIVVG
jgi:exonuclease III